ncbi:MAG: PQQ-binding-like beta-propeller repeat protein, partial [Planctomycetales bacterium]|nr:PQQ-binding-like beta-propeller repeat protein [Planctomycetales bacterium]
TAALAPQERYVVHGLATDDARVDAARRAVMEADKYGQVSIEPFHGDRLPYADNLVNLIVVQEGAAVADDELKRALAPRGVALIQDGAKWRKVAKPWPKEIDEWTHFMHGPDNNAVAKDSVVGPPHHLQWIGGPKWARGHEQLATISAVVTAHGRIFIIADDGPTASVDLPPQWTLFARDAFSGVQLWKRPIEAWESTQRPFRSGPPQLPRRLVAVGDTVYVTPGYLTPLTAIDAATGETKKVYDETRGTEEILFVDGTLFLVIGDPEDQHAADQAVRRGQPLPQIHKSVLALDAESGETRWKKEDGQTSSLMAQTLAVAGGRLFFQNTQELVCLDAASGDPLWKSARPIATKRPAWSVPTLIVQGDRVISADRQAPDKPADGDEAARIDWTVSFAGGNAPPGEMIAFDVNDGKEQWRAPCKEGYNAPVDLLLTDKLLWSGELVKASDPGITSARDPATGVVKRERPRDQVFFSPGMSHHRCYRNRATVNYLLLGRSGVELVDLKTGEASANHWVRGTCQFGVLPANGMIYVPPHTCACYLKTKLNGFNALAPLRPGEQANAVDSIVQGEQLSKGPALGQTAAAAVNNEDWPTYRHDALRSGAASTKVGDDLQADWQVEIGGDLTPVTAADNRVFVARKDRHTVYALDAATGETQWSFVAGGVVDGPPTIADGLALFGSRDGYVYCLRASDGALAWRFRAGPEDRRMMSHNQLESAWPVHGSVLVKDGVAYFAAGHSTYLDGGIFLYGLNVKTGEVVAQSRITDRDPQSGNEPKEAVRGFDMKGGLPDVLSTDGGRLFMRDLCFSEDCTPSEATSTHLFSPTGFIDDSWWHRTYWLYGTNFTSGWGGWSRAGNQVPAGRLMVIADDAIYGFGRDHYPAGNAGQWRSGEKYRLYSASLAPKPAEKTPPDDKPAAGRRRGGKAPVKSSVDFRWSQETEAEGHALVLAGERLYLAGPHGETHKDIEAFHGAKGISLRVYAAADGKEITNRPLESIPVLDGLCAARGRLLLATQDGKVTCYQAKAE